MEALKSLPHVNQGRGLSGRNTTSRELEAFRRFGNVQGQSSRLNPFAQLSLADYRRGRNQLNFSRRKAKNFDCQSHCTLGTIYSSKGEKGKALRHLKTALKLASPFGWEDLLFWVHYAWPSCFVTSTSGTMQTPISNGLNQKWLTAHAAWVVGRKCRPSLGISNASWEMQSPRLCAHLRSTRGLGM